MEIEVKDYVRTRAGHFYKVTKIDENGLIYWNKIQCGWSMKQLKDIVVKHSKNIIDLVEVGDLIKTNEEKTIIHIYDIDVLEAVKEDIEEGHFTIETIVTHEQFASIEYKIEEDK